MVLDYAPAAARLTVVGDDEGGGEEKAAIEEYFERERERLAGFGAHTHEHGPRGDDSSRSVDVVVVADGVWRCACAQRRQQGRAGLLRRLRRRRWLLWPPPGASREVGRWSNRLAAAFSNQVFLLLLGTFFGRRHPD